MHTRKSKSDMDVMLAKSELSEKDAEKIGHQIKSEINKRFRRRLF
jgi:Mn-dependent DtxR family transcriptional regulator